MDPNLNGAEPKETISYWKRFSPTKQELYLVLKSFSKKEWILFFAVAIFFFVSTLNLLTFLNNKISVEVPSYGGELSEGIIGTPRFINPVLAISEADHDLTSLVYAGLMKKTTNGDIVPELAESYEISGDGLSYTFVLKNNLSFQDGKPLTADDILFTINLIKDPLVKSPRRVSWEGVSVQKIDETSVKFTLKQKYFPFLESTTIGILPKHIWKDLTPEQFGFSDFNTNAVGAGPYEIKTVTKNSSGIPNYYGLSVFKDYSLGRPFIDNITIHFYPNQGDLITAFDNGLVQNVSSVDAKNTSALKESGYKVLRTPLPRIFAVFFNQNQNQIFTDKSVRKALSVAVDKDRITKEVLFGYGTAIETPIPGIAVPAKAGGVLNRYEKAKQILLSAGWAFNEKEGVMEKKNKKIVTQLKFSLSTGDVPELKDTAKLLKEDWEKIGVKVDLKIFEIGDLNQSIIRPRKYDAIFFGEIIGFNGDPFSFWHSSQRNDPGLNIALYTNNKADKILESLRGTLDKKDRESYYLEFEKEVEKDVPAVFVYSPDFTYLVNENLNGISLGNITIPSDRFAGIKDWYLKTDKVWKPFVRFSTR